MTISSLRVKNLEEKHESEQPLIPGLPNDISEHCLLYLPYPYQTLVRSVSSSWNRTIKNPSFQLSKLNLSLSLPYIFVFAFERSTAKLQWQAFDPRSSRWFVLPPMPCPKPVCPSGFACAVLPHKGSLYVLGGMKSDTESSLQTLITYRTSTNEWSLASPMLTPRSYFTAESIRGKIFAAGGTSVGQGGTISTVECYDPDKDTWTPVAKMRTGLAKYDTAVIGNKMYVTEGWTWATWPLSSPRGGVYDAERDTWQEMSVGLREGWTGISVVLDDKLFVISELGDHRLKVYVPESDTWKYVGGGEFPCKALQRPFSVSAVEGRIYVVSRGLDVGVGRVFEDEKLLKVEWEVVESPKAFKAFDPCDSQVLYS